MEPKDKDLESQETNEQENEVQDDENTSNEEGETSEGTEDEGSEEEGSEDGDSESDDDSDQEADKREANKRSAKNRISKRVKKLRGELDKSTTSQNEIAQKLAVAEERNRIQSLALEQRTPEQDAPVEPDPDKFDGGVHDPEYVKKYREFQTASNSNEIDERVKKQVEQAAQQERQTANNEHYNRESDRKQKEHYRRAIENLDSDYEETEDKAMEILGVDAVKEIINSFDDSEYIIDRLGKDPDLAEELNDSIAANTPIKTIRILERASIRGFKPKTKSKSTPNPDTPLPGGSPAAATGFEAKRLKMLKKATDMNDQSIYSDFMDKHREEEKAETAKHSVW